MCGIFGAIFRDPNRQADPDRVTAALWHDDMQRAGSMDEQRAIMRKFETRVLDEMAHEGLTLWWYKINPHRSYVKGWKVAPSHYLNQHLDNVWLDK